MSESLDWTADRSRLQVGDMVHVLHSEIIDMCDLLTLTDVKSLERYLIRESVIGLVIEVRSNVLVLIEGQKIWMEEKRLRSVA